MFTNKRKAVRYARSLRKQGHAVKVFVHDTIVNDPVEGNVAHRYYTVSTIRPEAQTHEYAEFRADGTNRQAPAYFGYEPVPTRERLLVLN